MAKQLLSRTWFMAHGYKPAKHPRLKRLLYINEEADILNPFGHKVIKYKLPNRHVHKSKNQYWMIRVDEKWMSVAEIMLATFVFMPDKKYGEEADHINGYSLDDRLSNLRVVDKPTNRRDGGFLRKLRHKQINPTMYASPFLLRFFDRMAEFKATHSRYAYNRLSRMQLLEMIVTPEFKVINPSNID